MLFFVLTAGPDATGTIPPRLDGTGTRCNLTHCGWVAGAAPRLVPVDPLAWRRNVRELRVRTGSAGPCKGQGVFATQAAGPGRFVAEYVGELLNLSQLLTRYAGAPDPVYVYKLNRSFSIDASDSTHFSRLINHDARPNLHASISKQKHRIEFFAVRPVSVGDELTIDYGVSYWRQRAHVPDEGSEPRLASDGRLPTCLPPDAPISEAEASAALARPTDASAAAFWRARSRVRGLASPRELTTLPLASSARAAGSLLRSLLRRLFVAHASVAQMPAGHAGGGAVGEGLFGVVGSLLQPRGVAGAWWPSESDARLAWRARTHQAALAVRRHSTAIRTVGPSLCTSPWRACLRSYF